MNIIKELKENIAKEIGTEPNKIELPEKFADLSFPCFELAKTAKKNPAEIAKELEMKLSTKKIKFIKEVKATGPYLNFFLDKEEFTKEILESVDQNYGNSGKGKKELIIIEHTSTNPSGPTHIGRIRNSFIGDSLARILKAIGYNVETHYYVNDMGKQIAIINWAIKNKIKPSEELMKKFEKYKNSPDFKTMFLYVPAMKIAEENKSVMEEIDQFLIDAETNKKYDDELKKVAKNCLKGQVKMLKKFGIVFDKFDFESDLVKKGKQKEIAEKLMKLPEYVNIEGNHAIDLSRHGFERRGGGTIFLRENGTSVYITRDLAYHQYKLSLADKNINILGEDHKIEAAELKKILELLGILKNKELETVFLAFVNYENVKISTRSGTTIPAITVLDEGIEKILEKNKMPLKNAEKIAVGAIKYFELKVSNSKQITFSWEDALATEGNTGPYLQYALVRAGKILEKSKPKKADLKLLNSEYEFDLIKKISLFPEIVEKAAEEYSPHLIASYAFDLSQLFSIFYEKCPVLSSEKELKNARLSLVKAFYHTLKNALYLLGIEEVKSM